MTVTESPVQTRADIIDITTALRSFDQLITDIEGAEIVRVDANAAPKYRAAA